MNPKEQRIKIAEACGWKPVGTPVYGWLNELYPNNSKAAFFEELPDYLNDLNAIHEAEKVLTWDQGMRYRLLLSGNSDGRKASFRTVEAAMCYATSGQRAQAFLMTLSLWKDK